MLLFGFLPKYLLQYSTLSDTTLVQYSFHVSISVFHSRAKYVDSWISHLAYIINESRINELRVTTLRNTRLLPPIMISGINEFVRLFIIFKFLRGIIPVNFLSGFEGDVAHLSAYRCRTTRPNIRFYQWLWWSFWYANQGNSHHQDARNLQSLPS